MNQLRPAIGVLISLALMWLFFRAANPTGLLDSLRDANYAYLVPALLVYFLGVWFRSERWRVLLDPVARLPTGRLFRAMLIGFTVNNLAPVRLGELARAYLLARWSGVPAAATLGTIVVERLFDGLVLCGVLGLAWLWLPEGSWLRWVAWLGLVGFIGGTLAATLAAIWPRWVLRAVARVARPLPPRLQPRVLELAEGFLRGFAILRHGRQVSPILALSALAWSCEAAMYFIIMLGFGLASGPASAVIGMAAANLGTMVPSSPGFVGTFDVPLQAVLTEMFRVDGAAATSYTIVVHSALILPVVVVGLVLLWREGLSLREVSRRARRPRTLSPSTGAAAETI